MHRIDRCRWWADNCIGICIHRRGHRWWSVLGRTRFTVSSLRIFPPVCTVCTVWAHSTRAPHRFCFLFLCKLRCSATQQMQQLNTPWNVECGMWRAGLECGMWVRTWLFTAWSHWTAGRTIHLSRSLDHFESKSDHWVGIESDCWFGTLPLICESFFNRGGGNQPVPVLLNYDSVLNNKI